jgi:membrane protein implicated in regulation of membrane protease activity
MHGATAFLDDAVLAIALLVAVAFLAPSLFPWALLGILLYTGGKAWLLRAHFRRPAVGAEAMVGRIATAKEDLAPRGHVDFDGELWQAESAQPARAGERVVVRAVEGLTLRVEPAGAAGGIVHEPPPGSLLLAAVRSLRRR